MKETMEKIRNKGIRKEGHKKTQISGVFRKRG
jgi:hypothetical protein